nr:Na+/H+ antiporter NhaA [Arenimonas sp.]
MQNVQRTLSRTFQAFFHSEKSSGILLIACTLVSLTIANSPVGAAYLGLWHAQVGGMSLEHWINDG